MNPSTFVHFGEANHACFSFSPSQAASSPAPIGRIYLASFPERNMSDLIVVSTSDAPTRSSGRDALLAPRTLVGFSLKPDCPDLGIPPGDRCSATTTRAQPFTSHVYTGVFDATPGPRTRPPAQQAGATSFRR